MVNVFIALEDPIVTYLVSYRNLFSSGAELQQSHTGRWLRGQPISARSVASRDGSQRQTCRSGGHRTCLWR